MGGTFRGGILSAVDAQNATPNVYTKLSIAHGRSQLVGSAGQLPMPSTVPPRTFLFFLQVPSGNVGLETAQ